MDSLDREAPVTMLDWRTGRGTARYWVSHLPCNHFAEQATGETAVVSTESFPPLSPSTLFAQGFVTNSASDSTSGSLATKVLLVNKEGEVVVVKLNVTSGSEACVATAVDSDIDLDFGPRSTPCNYSKHIFSITLKPFATAVVTLS